MADFRDEQIKELREFVKALSDRIAKAEEERLR